MKLGKLEWEYLEPILKRHLPLASLSLDANTLPVDESLVISTNPALGVPLETLGFFAFHYTASNLACMFARPLYMVSTVIMPPGSTEDELEVIMRELGAEARRYGVEVVGGHTGVYKGVSIPVLVTTCIGRRARRPGKPLPGDRVVIVGEVASESLWLAGLTGKVEVPEDFWRKLTPLPKALDLMSVASVKVMHDVSEGGVLGALLELSKALGVRLRVSTRELPLAEGVDELGVDVLRAPSYGVLVAVVDAESMEVVEKVLRERGYAYSVAGVVERGSVAVEVDGVAYRSVERTVLDEVYGEVLSTDPVISSLELAFREIEGCRALAKLIPEVGMNMVYAKEGASSIEEVAGLSGRVVRSLGKPKVCGKVVYGGSRHLAQVVVSALKYDERMKAAVNLRASNSILRALEKLGLKAVEVDVKESGSGCPVADFISERGVIGRAYYHAGAHGVEPSIVVLASTPRELVDMLLKVASLVTEG